VCGQVFRVYKVHRVGRIVGRYVSTCPIFETTDRVEMAIGIWDCRAYNDGYRAILILVGKLSLGDPGGVRSKA